MSAATPHTDASASARGSGRTGQQSGTFGRRGPPPHDLEAEAAVVSAAMLNREARDAARDALSPEDFFLDRNRRVWEAICAVDDSGATVDEVTVVAKLRDQGRLEQVGGVTGLAELIDATPAVANVEDHAAIVRDRARLRRVLATCTTLAAEAHAGQVGDVDDFCQRAEQAVFDATQTGSSVEVSEHIGALAKSAVNEVMARRSTGGAVAGTPSGWKALDAKLNGWLPVMYVVAARPGMGKTAMALQAVYRVALGGEPGVFFSSEMPKEQLILRLLASESGLDIQALASGRVSDGDLQRLIAAAKKLASVPMHIAYRPGASVQTIRSVCRRALSMLRSKLPPDKQEGGIIAADYIQIFDGGRKDTRETEVSDISRGLMRMAGEFNVPVLALSQLNRKVEERADKRPQLSDLRESGAIEQDAYAVMLLYRDDYYHQNSPDAGVLRVDIAKHRNGPTGVVDLRFEAKSTRIDETWEDDGYGDFDAA